MLTTGEVLALIDNLRSWAQNEEMINAFFTDHGIDCNDAANELEEMLKRERVETRSHQ